MIARAVHATSSRRTGFIAVSCSATARDFARERAFRYEKGAFTGPTGPRKGRFGLATAARCF